MTDRRVLITGLGAVSCFGTGVDAFWRGLCTGGGHAEPLPDPHAHMRSPLMYQVPLPDVPAEPRRLGHVPLGTGPRMGVAAAQEALADAGLDRPAQRRLSVVLGVEMGNASMHEQRRSATAAQVDRCRGSEGSDAPSSPQDGGRWVPLTVTAPAVAAAVGATGGAVSIGNACAASGYAVSYAADMIRAGAADVALAGGAEGITRVGVGAFNRLGAADARPGTGESPGGGAGSGVRGVRATADIGTAVPTRRAGQLLRIRWQQRLPRAHRAGRPAMTDMVVTGLGIVAPGVAKPTQALDPVLVHSPGWFDVAAALPGRGYRWLPPACQYLLAAAQSALEDARDPLDSLPVERRGVVVGTNNASMALMDRIDRTIIDADAAELSPLSAPFSTLDSSWADVCGAESPSVEAVLDDSPVGAAVENWLIAQRAAVTVTTARAGCLTPLRRLVGLLATGLADRVVVTAAAEGNVALTRLTPCAANTLDPSGN